MAKQTITPSFRLNVEDYMKLKELKEKSGISWTKFIAYANELISGDMEESNNDR